MPLTFTFRTQMSVLTYTFLIITDIKLKYLLNLINVH